MNLVSSIVLFKNSKEIVQKSIDSFLEQDPKRQIVLVDHSPSPTLSSLVTKSNISYHHNPDNPGFGAGHNFAHRNNTKANEIEKYIVIQNPDVFVSPGCIQTLIEKMEADPQIGLITCKVMNPDGSVQKLLKNDPNLFALITRRLPILSHLHLFRKALLNYEIKNEMYDIEGEIPIVSGCFFIISRNVWDQIGGFDERYFLYFEDFDICRKVRSINKKIFYTPQVEIIHLWTRGAHKSSKHLFYFLRSMVQYFNKWGWRLFK